MAGVPARVIGIFDDYVNKRMTRDISGIYPEKNGVINEKLIKGLWLGFNNKR